MSCEYVERTLRELLYKPEYLGSVSLSRLRSIFSSLSQSELEECIKKLIKNGRGWELSGGYLVNREVVSDILYNEKARLQRRLNECQEKISVLEEEANTLEEIRRIWLENPMLKGRVSVMVKIYVNSRLSEEVIDLRDKISRIEKESVDIERLLREIESKIENSYRPP